MSHSAADRAQSLRKPNWAEHKDAIEDLYLKQKNTLKGVMKVMEARGFNASEQQYKIKLAEWGFSKYKKGGDTRNGRGNSSRGQAKEMTAASGHSEETTAAFRGQPDDASQLGPDMNMSDANPGLNNQSLWNGNIGGSLSGTLGLNEDVDIRNNNGSSNVSELNLGISQSQGVSAPLRSISTTSTRTFQPIHLAVISGNLSMLKLLLDMDPLSAVILSPDGATAIGMAAEYGRLNMVRLFLTYKDVDVNCKDEENFYTPIHQAAENGHTEIVRALLSHGALIDPVDDDGITPLWSAVHDGYHEIVQLLIDAGADTEASSKVSGRRPLHQASHNGRLEIARILINAGAMVNPHVGSFSPETPSPLWLAAQEGHCEIVRLLIQQGADVEFSGHPSKLFPIHLAVQCGNVGMVDILIQSKANVDAREVDGWSPLMFAAQHSRIEVVDLLLQNGANVNAENKNGETALWIASQNGHLQIMKKLLEHGAKSFATRSSQRLPIHLAAKYGYLEAVKLLLDAHPQDVHAEDEKDFTPLHHASMGETEGHVEVARYLIDKGAKVVS